ELGSDPRRIRLRPSLVAWNGIRMVLDVERVTRESLEQRNRLVHGRLQGAADVVGAVTLERRDRRVDDVRDVGPTPGLRAVAEELEPAACGERRGDPRERHVGALARTERVEVAQDDALEPELAPVGVGEMLARELADPVRRERVWLRLLRR